MKTEAGEELVVMGRVVAPYGVLGWIKIKPETEWLDSLLDYPNWYFGNDKLGWRLVEVSSAKPANDLLAIKLTNVNDRDAAFALKNQLVAVPKADLPPAAEDEFYWADLIGLQVTNLENIEFGEIKEVFATGANDVLVVLDANTKLERLIPFVAQVILQVDTEAKQMRVDWDADF